MLNVARSLPHMSIQMPLVNGARYVRRAVDAILEQTYDCWSLSIYDAGSTDGSWEIVQEYSRENPKISSYQASDTGIYDALCKAFEGADGDVFAWLNADDMFLPWTFSQVADAFLVEGVTWVGGYPAIWDKHDQVRSIVPVAAPHARWIREGWMHDELLGCIQQESTFFSAGLWRGLSLTQKQRFSSLKLAGDFYLWTQFAEHASLQFIPTVLGGFRRHKKNRSVAHRSLYQQEVYECGGKRLPAWLAKKARGLHDLISTRRALYAARAAMAHLVDELEAEA